MYGYVYEVTNLINGKKYIGQKKSEIFLGNKYLGRGVIIKQAHAKYGLENFTSRLLKECDSAEELDYFEKYFIKFYNAVEDSNYYNIAAGGEGGNTLAGFSEEKLNAFKAKMHNILKDRVIVNKDGKEYHIKKDKLEVYLQQGFSVGRGNFTMTEKYRKAQRDRNLGRKRSLETRQRMSNSFKGRKYSDEVRKHMSEAAKARAHTYWMCNEYNTIKIREELIPEYLALGYKRGRKYYQ
nr:MAG TPA: intron associated endonuclease [Caudoviricetes sp.]